MDVERALAAAEQPLLHDRATNAGALIVLAAEVRWLREELQELRAEDHKLHGAYLRLRAERERMGTLPFEAAFLVQGEPEQLIFRGPNGQVLLRRVRDGEA